MANSNAPIIPTEESDAQQSPEITGEIDNEVKTPFSNLDDLEKKYLTEDESADDDEEEDWDDEEDWDEDFDFDEDDDWEEEDWDDDEEF